MHKSTRVPARTASVDSKVRQLKNVQDEFMPELYNLADDLGCSKNVITEKHDIAVGLRKEFVTFLRSRKYPEEYLQYFRTV